jgi:hypothetical protein
MKNKKITTGYDSPEFQNRIVEILCNSNNPAKSKIRAEFRALEREIYKLELDDYFSHCDSYDKLLVAGSGLGNEIQYLLNLMSKAQIIGVEKNQLLYKISKNHFDLMKESWANAKQSDELMHKRVNIINADFFNLPFEDGEMKATILNCGTIGDFPDEQKIVLIKELARVTRGKLLIDFYEPSQATTNRRLKMYEEEGIVAKVKGNAIISDDPKGFYSEAMAVARFDNLVHKALGTVAIRGYREMPGFGWMYKVHLDR